MARFLVKMSLSNIEARMWLLYLKLLQGKRGKLSFNITREVCEYLTDCFPLVEVTSTLLSFCARGPQILLHALIQVDNNSTWVMLNDGRLFCSGGGIFQVGHPYSWSVAYLLSHDGKVEQLPDMLYTRRWHGVIQLLQIYIFGGCKL